MRLRSTVAGAGYELNPIAQGGGQISELISAASAPAPTGVVQ